MNAALTRLTWNRLRPAWVSLVLLAFILLIVMTSIAEAKWLDDSKPLLNLLFLGMVFGALLSTLCWPGWFAGLYTALASLLVSLQTIGRVLPSPATLLSQSLAESSWGIRVRTLNLFERISGWIAGLNRGENITDTGLFVLIFGVVIWAATAWLAWNALRRQRPLAGLLPLGVLLGVNVYLSDQGLTRLWLFILLALLLVARGGYMTLHLDWDRRKVDYPEDLLDWTAGAMLSALVIAILVSLLPLVATPEGWDLLSEWTRKARESTAQTAERLFSDVNPVHVESNAVHATTPNLHNIGQPVSTGNETVMWVTVSDPPPPPREVSARVKMPPQHYWRNEILTTYDGHGWEPARLQIVGALPGFSGEAPNGRYPLEQKFELMAQHGVLLFSVSQPALPGEGVSLRYAQPEGSTLLAGNAGVYEVTSYATQITAVQLRNAETNYPPEIFAAYTQLPASLPERVRNMADRVTGKAENAYEKALRIQDYLRQTYPYNPDVPPPPPERDAVDYFLYEAQEGFCSYYASAMVVLLRAQGVPSRVVTGFATGEYDARRGAYRVPLSASHAWVEVYFPKYGWVEFEPTPSRSPFVYPEEPVPGNVENAQEKQEDKAPTSLPVASPLALAAGGLLLALLLGFAGVRLWDAWSLQKKMKGPANRSAWLYWQVRRALARSGMHTGASATPNEFLAAFEPALLGRARLLSALRLATALYQQASFSPAPPHPDEISATRRAWQQALSDRWKLRLDAARKSFLKQRKRG